LLFTFYYAYTGVDVKYGGVVTTYFVESGSRTVAHGTCGFRRGEEGGDEVRRYLLLPLKLKLLLSLK
jgi:hypothetical protein